MTTESCRRTTVLPSLTLPLDDRWDVIVLGGGPAGCTAAAAAGRAGARTLLIEASGCLGGSGTSALVPAWTPFTDKRRQIYRGLAGTIFERCKARTFGVDPAAMDWVPIDAECLKVIYDDLLAENGVTVRFCTMLAHVQRSGAGRIEQIVTSSKAGLEAWSAQVFVDATGDADLCAWAGAEFQKGTETGALMPGTMCFVLGGVDLDAYRRSESLHSSNLKSPIWRIVKEGKYPEIPDAHCCNNIVGPHAVGFNAGHVFQVDNTIPDTISRGLREGRRLAHVYLAALKEYQPEVYGKAYVASTGSQLGVRETRRIIGDHVLSMDDWIMRRSFDDEIARNAYYIDIHLQEADMRRYAQAGMQIKEAIHYKPGESHGIPYRCLCPKDLVNTLVVGRCISSDRPVQGSVRVMPVCLAMGEAAGVAAAQAARDNGGDVHVVDVQVVRRDLRNAGAYLP